MRNLQNQIKMNTYTILIAIVVLGTIISCSPAQRETNPATQVQQQIQLPQSIGESDTAATLSSNPATVQSPATSNNPTVVNKTTSPPELNPPHGQPYHRCDIPVGSPLNAAPSVKIAPAINNNGTAPTLENAARLNRARSNNTTVPTLANTNPPKNNPAHGQPFHRCDIPVGSPLPVN